MKKTLLSLLLSSSLVLPAQSFADAREVIWLNPDEKTSLLSEMRLFLETSQQILQATLEDDMPTVERLARQVGIKMMKETPAELMQKLPKGFTEIGPQAHLGFEDIANEASGLGDGQVILKRLAQLQLSCVSCHAQYQIKSD